MNYRIKHKIKSKIAVYSLSVSLILQLPIKNCFKLKKLNKFIDQSYLKMYILLTLALD
jgi:hypothetical protein